MRPGVRDERAYPDRRPEVITPQDERGDTDPGRGPYRGDLLGDEGKAKSELRSDDVPDGDRHANADESTPAFAAVHGSTFDHSGVLDHAGSEPDSEAPHDTHERPN